VQKKYGAQKSSQRTSGLKFIARSDERGVGTIAVMALEIIVVHAVIILEMGDHGFYGGASRYGSGW
jgi:hypothetical protein